MAQAFWTRLSQRGVVEIGGLDAGHFLQSLVTNDIDIVAPGKAGYGALLSPQGKVQFDFIVFRDGDRFLFDLPRDRIAAFVARLTFYRLRSPVEITDRSDDLDLVGVWGDALQKVPTGVFALDPRLAALGHRAFVQKNVLIDGGEPSDEATYHRHRIALGVPEGGLDFTYEDAFPHDANIDQLGGIAFAKGCYIGQEVVSRMEHRGTARRRVVQLRGKQPLQHGSELTAGDQPVGTVGSTDELSGLAMVRIDRVGRALSAGTPIMANGDPVALTIPDWASFNWPATEDNSAS